MKIIDNQNRVFFDVDDTLIRNPKESDLDVINLNYYGMDRPQAPINSNIQLLIAYKRRGYDVTVHTANGVEWAQEVVSKLKLEQYVDWVATKPDCYVDDRDANDWMQRVYVEEN